MVSTIVPGQKLELFMGIDDKIKVKRELINRYTRKKGLGNKDISIEYAYKLTIESFKEDDYVKTQRSAALHNRNTSITFAFFCRRSG